MVVRPASAVAGTRLGTLAGCRARPAPGLAGGADVHESVRGARRTAGRTVGLGAALALLVGLVLSIQAAVFHFSTAEAVGEVVAVEAVRDAAGEVREDRHAVVVEYPDRNGQFRRFDQEVEGTAPEKGAEIGVRYRMGPPVEARIANAWWLWRPASVAGAIALILGLAAEELLRQRRRVTVLESQ